MAAPLDQGGLSQRQLIYEVSEFTVVRPGQEGAGRVMRELEPGAGIEDMPRVRLVPDQEVVESLAPQGSDDPFAARVHPRGPPCGPDDADVVGIEDRTEGLGVLRVPVVEQETQRVHPNAQLGGMVSRLLHRQESVGRMVTPAMCSLRVP
ncbi:hypothetical protein AB0A94_15715 [Streptomyces sp. NPDC044984]|uniref:hypothetical protein n=1 Tax=Streptomyces sp. NPDC044984 TaxID=3154335 RepID=UPI0033E5DFE1